MSELSHCRGPELVIGQDDPRSLAGWLTRAAELAPQAGVRVQLDPERSEFVDYPTLLARAHSAAAGLLARGVAPGQHVVLQLPCSLDYFTAAWACVLAGALPVTVARPDSPGPVLDKLAAVWTDLGRPVVLTGEATLATVAGLLPGATVLALPGGREDGPLPEPVADGVALTQVSSGSTGRPKLIPLTHRGLLELGVAARLRPGFQPGDTTFNWLPLDHSGAFLLYHLAAVFAGATTVHAPTELITADPLRLLDLLQRHAVNHAWWPNFGYQLLADLITANPDRHWDLSSLRTLLNGGEQCTLPVVRAFLAAAGRFGISASTMMFTWGMAETTTAIAYSRLDDPATVRDGRIAVGTPDPGAELRIVDTAGALMPRGEVGRLQVRSARVTPGYLGDPAATGIGVDSWLATGDLAVMHGDVVTITGRENDLIILNGKNHMAADLESALADLGATVAACGVPDPATGSERLVIFIEVGPGAGPDVAPALAARVRATLATRRHLTGVLVVALPELPRTTSGKLRRAALRERFAAGEFTPVPVAAAPRARTTGGGAGLVELVRGLLTEVLGRSVPADRPFYELGVSSLHIAQLHERLQQRLGRDLPRTVFFEHPTALLLAARLAGSEPASTVATTTHRPPSGDRRIAVIGMAARLPGASTLADYWANLRGGVTSIRRFTPAELAAAAEPGFVAAAATLDGIDEFDAELFHLSAAEAALTDPAQRLFLQCCRHALEHAGHGAAETTGRVGVFAGCGMNLYPGHDYLGPVELAAAADPVTAAQATMGNRPDFLATRVAYRLGLTGPALSVQTACSTSLVAVHLAAASLLAGECELALAGAAAVHVPQITGYRRVAGSILSPSGCCRPFDAGADGTVGGSGVAAVLLKPLAAALADGDTVHAVLLGSAIGNDGAAKVSFTAPGVAGQVRTITGALAAAGVSAESIGYVEAHGTGTELGDPIEVAALTSAFRRQTDRVGYCALGSAKANVGHLDSCAGLAGLLKVVLLLGAGELPPQAGLRTPHPELGLESSPFVLPTRRQPWSGPTPRRALVAALGVGGTNAHLVVEQAPPPRPRVGHAPLGVLPLSAASPQALAELADSYRRWLPDQDPASTVDVLVTAAAGRSHHRYRTAAYGTTPAELVRSLQTAAAGPGTTAVLAFCFTGQGCSPPTADALGTRFPVFAATWAEATAAGGDAAQPALFAYQVALAALWRSWGVEPALVLGHSLGEYAALCAAGAITVADGARLTAARDRLMNSAAEPGGLVAVLTSRAVAAELLASVPGLELAVVNGPAHHVLGGPVAAVQRLVAELDAQRLPYRRLAASRAFHTSTLEGMLDGFRAVLDRVELGPLSVPLASTVGDGATLLDAGTVPDPGYLLRQAREVARFDLATARLDGHLPLEIGPDDTLTRMARAGWVPSQRRGEDPLTALTTALGELYRQGADLDWAAVTAGCAGRRVPVPLYPYRRESHWLPRPTPAETTELTGGGRRMSRANEVLDVIRGLVAGRIGQPPEQVVPDTSFVGLGADSLTMVAVVGELDTRFGVRIGMRELFAGTGDTPAADTPRRLAELVASRLPDPPPAAATPVPTPPAPAAATAAPAMAPVAGGDGGLRELFAQQLGLLSEFSAVLRRQLDLLAPTPAAPATPGALAAPAAAVAAVPAVAAPLPAAAAGPAVEPLPPLPDHPALAVPASGTCDFSVYFFGDYPDGAASEPYASVLDTATFADKHGFHAVWLPERHFHSFGGIFPNPSVLAAAVAARTTRIRLHAGSVVLPLHHPVRVAEEWSVVDNLSGGRAGLCVASGWHSTDFVLQPQNYGRHREVMYRDLDTVRTLWSGGTVTARSGSGDDVPLRLYPRPVQALPPLYAAVVGNPDSYRLAGERGLGVVTNLMTQDLDALAANLRGYRAARRDAGLDPDTGRVVVLLHTHLGADADAARRAAFEPFCRYLRSSLSLFGGVTNSLGFDIDLERTPEDDLRFLLEQAYARYCESRALIGSPASVAPTVDALLAAGVHEIACFVDFGLDPDTLRAGLPAMDQLRRRYHGQAPDAPLSAAQQRLWILHEMFPDRPMYNEPRAIGLDGMLDVVALRRALTQLVTAHPALRTVFRTVDGEPRQLVLDPAELDCPLIDHSADHGADHGADPGADHGGVDENVVVGEVMARESRRRFDLAAGPPLLASLLRFAPDRHVLVLSVHHIVSDGLSWVVLFDDLARCYRSWRAGGPAQLAPQTTSYLEYARAQRSTVDKRRADDLRFWLDRLRGLPTVLELPSDRPRPAVMGGEGRSFFVHLDTELTGRVRRFGLSRGVTPFMALLGGFAAMLSSYTGQHRLILGAAVANRPPGTENLVGMFVDTLPLAVDLTGDPSFAELVARIRVGTAEAYDHAGVPFDELVAELNPRRDLGRNPLFQVMVEYENDSGTGFELPDLTATLLEVAPQKAPFDLTCYLANLAETVQCHVEYNAELFDEPTVRRFLAQFAHLLAVAVAEPDTPLSQLPSLTEDDAAALRSWQGGPAPTPGLLHDGFVRQAAAGPERLALDGTDQLSYRELDQRSHRLAAVLRGRGVGAGQVVAILLPPGAELVVALLGVLRAGGCYLPLDPGGAPARQRFQLADSGAAVLLTDGPAELTARTVLRLDDAAVRAELAAADDQLPALDTAPDSPAYLIYTSGSTGRPKGVVMPHRGPSSVVAWYVAAHPPLRTLQWTSCGFDVSVLEIFATLAGGGTVVLPPEKLRYDPRALASWLREHRVQRLGLPYTPLKYFAEALADDPALPDLREIITIGEALRLTPALRGLLAANPRCTLFNEYGPTETSVIVSSQRVEPDGPAAPPIGRLVDGVRGHLLDAAGQPVPVGAAGELHLAGQLLADGYLGRPDQTAAAFVPDPFGPALGAEPGGRLYRTGDLARWRGDGTLEFLGRVDDQVKIRGHRVEPGEVAAVLRELPGVGDAVVLARTDRGEEPYLAAYLVPDTDRDVDPARLDPARLGTALRERLPDHMVPAAWVVLTELPLNQSGKLDRGRLPQPDGTDTTDRADTADGTDRANGTDGANGVDRADGTSRGGTVPGDRDPAGVSEVEQALLRLWRAELGGTAPRLRPDTEFFAVGGHSLNAIRLLTRVREEFGVDYPVLDFFQAPTVRAMARRLDQPRRVRGSV